MRRVVALAAVIGVLALHLAAPRALAFDLTGCQLTVTSADPSGATIGTASGPGAGGTLDSPFPVHPKGTVHYDGNTLSVIMHHTWHVDVYGVPILTGGDPNEGGSTEGSGDVGVAQYAADRVAGLFFVSGTLVGEGGSCTGSGWVKLLTDPIGTIPWLIGLALAGFGLVTLAFAMPSWRSATVIDRAAGPPPPP
jgi:hypothetical protein